MKKFTRLLTLLVCLTSLFAVKAQETVVYQQSFENLNVSDHSFAPEGWGHIVDSMEPFSYGSNIYVPYKNPTTGGALDGKGFLKAGSQLLEDEDPYNPDPWSGHKEKNAKDYLVTPAINGVVSFYLKNDGSGNVKIYKCSKNGAKYVVDEAKVFKEIASSEITAEWKLFELPVVSDGSCLAFRLENVGIDELSVKQSGTPTPAPAGYLEKFDGLDVSKHDFAPKGWSHIVAKYFDAEAYEDFYVDYQNPATDGQDGAYLKAGSQNLGAGWVTETVNDYLVTPAIGGEVSFYLKKYKNSSNVKVFKAEKKAGKFTIGASVKVVKSAELSEVEWKKITIPAVAEGTYLAFRLEDIAIDEFSAEKLVTIPSLEIVSLTNQTETKGGYVVVTPDNKFEIVCDVTVRNSGTVDLTPGMENYSLTVFRKNAGKEEVLATVAIDQALAMGATSTPIRVVAKVDAGTEAARLQYSVKENISNQVKNIAWIESKPAAPELKLTNENGNEIEATDVIDFGLLKDAAVTKSFNIVNDGFAPLNITGLTLPEGYTTTFKVPAVVAAQGSAVVEVTLNNAKAGTFSGKVVVTGEKVAAKEVAVIGAVIDANVWYEDFEAKEIPSNMIFGENWKLSTFPVILGTETNKQWAENGISTEPSMLVTPLLKVKAGQAFTIRAGKRNTNSLLSVYYSADRVNWTLAKKVDISEFTNDKAGSSYDNFKFTMMSFDNIPEGEWYIGLEGGYVRVDDLFGYELVAVDHDFFVNSANIPVKAMVNYPATATVNVKNLGVVEAAGSYAVKLYVNNEVVAEAETEEFPLGDKSFDITFTPHVAGTFPAYVEISAGNVVVETAETEITISEESAEGANKIGAQTVSLKGEVPARFNYKNSESQTIYTAERLAAAGVVSGSKIIKLSYDGYCTSDKNVVSNISIYLENTTDVNPSVDAPKDVAGMTLVYNGDVEIIKGGSSTNSVAMLAAPLATPFEYTGNNLRVIVVAKSTSYKQVYFEADATVQDATIYKYSDGDITKATWYAGAMPLANFYTQREVPTLSGKVYTEEYGPLPNVKVKLVSNNVLYTAVTNAEGVYSMKVFQTDKKYSAVIDEIPEYVPYTHAELIDMSKGSQVINFCVSPLSGVENIEAAGLAVYGAKGCIVVKATAAEMVNVYNIAGRLVRNVNVEEGTTTVDGLMAGFYIVNGSKVLVR